MIRRTLLAVTALLGSISAPAAAGPNDPLRIVQFDFEGGGGTLFVTPNGRTIMVDSGWPSRPGRAGSAPAIAAAVRAAGARRIDYLVTTHYHFDHIGGLAELVKLVPVGTFVDHGPNREFAPPNRQYDPATLPEALYPGYEAIVRGKRRSMRAGETLTVDGVELTALTADRKVLERPLPGAGEPGTACDSGRPFVAATNEEENPRSLGIVLRHGKGRVMLLGDATLDVELRLVCPVDLVGRLDLAIASHHGSGLSNNPPLYATTRPRVIIIPNGERKGGDPEAFRAVAATPGLQGLWQIHETNKPGAQNGDRERIANLIGETPDANRPLLIDLAADGTVTVTNPRNGSTARYPRPQ